MTEENDKNIQERIDERTVRDFWITNCPEKVWKEFNTYAKEETNNNYSIALKLLLNSNKANAKEKLLYERYIQLDTRMRQLEKKQNMILEMISKEEVETEEEVQENQEDQPERKNIGTMGGTKINVPDGGD